MTFVVYHCHCHQSNGPAGGYQGVGNGKVVCDVDDNLGESVVDLVSGFVVVVVEDSVLPVI
jgi:hypothetical protein